MNFTKSELEMLYQYAAPTKEETLAGLKEIVPVLERKDDLLTKMIVENTVRKLEKLAEPECSLFLADNRAAFIESGTIPSGNVSPQPKHRPRSLSCWGMTWRAWSVFCRNQNTWLHWIF